MNALESSQQDLIEKLQEQVKTLNLLCEIRKELLDLRQEKIKVLEEMLQLKETPRE